MTYWQDGLVGSMFLLSLIRPQFALTALLSLLILGDRQGAHLHATVAGIPIYIAEAGLVGLVLNRVRAGDRSVFWPRLAFWKGFYAVSVLSVLRGLLVYPFLQVIRDAALSYYSLFTHLTRSLFEPGTVRLRRMGLVLAGCVLLKSILSLCSVPFFYQEGSAASIYAVDTLILSLFTLGIWGNRWFGYPVIGFLAYVVSAYLFRSSWFGLLIGIFFYIATLRFHRTSIRRLATGFVFLMAGVTTAILYPPSEELFKKPLGRTENASVINVLKDNIRDITSIAPPPKRLPPHPLHPVKITPPTAVPAKNEKNAYKPNNVLAQFNSVWAGMNSKNMNTRVWLWQDLLEDLFSVQLPFYQMIRLNPEKLGADNRKELEQRLGPIRLDSEIPNSWQRNVSIGWIPLKIDLGVPFGKVFVPPRAFYWMTQPSRYDPHNSFLSILYRLGLLGFALFSAILVGEFRLTFRSLPHLSQADQLIALGLMGAIVSHCADAFFSVSLENSFKGILFWVFIGALHVVRSNTLRRSDSMISSNPLRTVETTPLKRKVLALMESSLAGLFVLCLKPRRLDGPVQRIGFLEVNRLGDLVLSGPALERLRAYYPQAHIVLIGSSKFKDVIQDHPAIDDYFELDVPWMDHHGKYFPWHYFSVIRRLQALRQLRLDVILDSRGDVRRHALMAYVNCPVRVSYDRFIGGIDLGSRGKLLTQMIPYPPGRLHRIEENVYLVDFWAQTSLGRHSTFVPPLRKALKPLPHEGPLQVGLHIHSNWPNKVWSDSHWIQLMDKIQHQRVVTFSVLGDDPVALEQFKKMAADAGVTVQIVVVPLSELSARLDSLHLLFGVDSGPMHMADALGCPMVALFGPSDISTWYPYNNGIQSVLHRQAACPVAPCKVPTCILGDSRCIQQVTVNEAFEKFEGLTSQFARDGKNDIMYNSLQ